jgi:hypothetical protein
MAEKSRPTKFSEFAVKVRTFEKTLIGLVMSSFVFSAVGLIAQLKEFKDEPGFIAISELISGITGAAAILIAYIARSHHPKDEIENLMLFEGRNYAANIGFAFILSAVCLYLYYRLARAGSHWCLLFLSLGCFFFFLGLVRGMFVTDMIETQRAVWYKASPEVRKEWAERKESLEETLDSVKQPIEGIEEAKRMEKKLRWLEWKYMINNALKPISRFWWKLRYSIGGKKLLTSSERMELAETDQEIEKWLENIDPEMCQVHFEKIRAGNVRPLPLEESNIEIHEIDSWRYLLIEDSLDTEKIQEIVEILALFKHPETEKLSSIIFILLPGSSITYNAKNLLEQAGIGIYEPER